MAKDKYTSIFEALNQLPSYVTVPKLQIRPQINTYIANVRTAFNVFNHMVVFDALNLQETNLRPTTVQSSSMGTICVDQKVAIQHTIVTRKNANLLKEKMGLNIDMIVFDALSESNTIDNASVCSP